MQRRRLSSKERKQVYDKYTGHCAYCGCEIKFLGFNVEHMVPLHLGGIDELSNMVPACRSCNHYKSTMNVEKFREFLSWIPSRLRRDNIAYQVGERFGIVKETGEPVRFYFEEGENE